VEFVTLWFIGIETHFSAARAKTKFSAGVASKIGSERKTIVHTAIKKTPVTTLFLL